MFSTRIVVLSYCLCFCASVFLSPLKIVLADSGVDLAGADVVRHATPKTGAQPHKAGSEVPYDGADEVKLDLRRLGATPLEEELLRASVHFYPHAAIAHVRPRLLSLLSSLIRAAASSAFADPSGPSGSSAVQHALLHQVRLQ